MAKSEYKHNWYLKNKARLRKKQKAYYKKNKTTRLLYQREYAEVNKEKVQVYAALYRQIHNTKLKAQAKDYYAKTIGKHRKLVRETKETERLSKLIEEQPIKNIYGALWLAGLLEGEGSFSNSRNTIRIDLRMTDKDVVEQAIAEIRYLITYRPRLLIYTQADRKTIYGCVLYGINASKLMQLLLPYMGRRRSSRILGLLSEDKGSDKS